MSSHLAPRDLLGVAIAAVAATAVLWIVYGGGYLSYDAMYSLVWGKQIASLSPPDLTAPGTPTSHPLSNLIAAPLALLGTTSEKALLLVTYMAALALITATGLLAATIFDSVLAGLAASALIATRPALSFYTAMGQLDVLFAALVTVALLVEVRTPRRATAVLLLLGAAGLLRPEAWVMAGAYWVWLAIHSDWPTRIRYGVIVAVPPMVWALTDLISTGNPTYSFTDTREAAAVLAIPKGVNGIVHDLPGLLAQEVRGVVLIGAAGGLAVVIARHLKSGLVIGGLLTVTIASLAPIAAGGLLLERYLLPTIALLCVLCGGFATAWLPHLRRQPAWSIGGATVFLLLVASIPSQLNLVRDDRGRVKQVAQQRSYLRELLAHTKLPCEPIVTPNDRLRPLIAIWRDIPIDQIQHIDRDRPKHGAFVTGDPAVYANLVYLPARDARPPTKPPASTDLVSERSGWQLRALCPPPASG